MVYIHRMLCVLIYNGFTIFHQYRCSKSWDFHALFINQVRLFWEINNVHGLPHTKVFSNKIGDISSKTCHHLQPWGTVSGSDPDMQCTPPMHTGSCGRGVLKILFPFPSGINPG